MCGSGLQKWGKQRSGKARYRCPKCGVNSTGGRPYTQDKRNFHLFTQWLLGNRSLNEIAHDEGVNRSTLYRRFLKFKGKPCKPKPFDSSNQVIIIDGTYLGKRKGEQIAVLIARTKTQVVYWRFCHRECFETWQQFLCQLSQPQAVVCDGQKGMIKAINLVWNDQVIIQRCLFHIQASCLNRLTQNPTLVEAQQLRTLCVQICRLNTIEQRDGWLDLYINWKNTHHNFLHQKATYLHPITNRLVSYYLHANTRSIVSSIDRALPNMFHYLDNPDIPRTSNHLEGGTNSRLKELIHRHRGTSIKNKLVLTARYLRKQQKIA